MQPTAATPGPIGLHRPEPATAASTPPVPGRRILHLTTEFPPVIYGGLGTAVGGWVTASARAGMTMGVLLVEGELVIDDPAGSARHGAGGRGGTHPLAREIEGGERAVVDRAGIRFFQ